MSNYLSIYKQNKINELNRNFNNILARLNSTLASNVRFFHTSRLINKQSIINSLISKYNNDISILRRNLIISINKVNSFTPEFNVVKTNNKKALLRNFGIK